MKILLLGGTGAMGSHLAHLLADRGDNLYITTRRVRESHGNISFLQGNAHDVDFLSSLLKGNDWDAIVDFMVYDTDEFQSRSNLFLTATRQYVFISSARVYADCNGLITENSPRLLDVCSDRRYLETDEYALTKARQENILFNSGKKNWTIIRPYITFSENRLQLSSAEKEQWLYWALLFGKPIYFSHDLADRYTTLTYGLDVARGIASILGNEKAYGQAFHITSEESYRWNEILNTYLDVINKKTGKDLEVRFLESWQPLIGGGALQVKWDRLYDRRFDNSKIKQFIDTTSFQPILTSISNCMSCFLDNPRFSAVNWGYQAQRDKIEGAWTSLKDIGGTKQKIKYMLVRLNLYHL